MKLFPKAKNDVKTAPEPSIKTPQQIFKDAHIDINRYPIRINERYDGQPEIGYYFNKDLNEWIAYKVSNPDLNRDVKIKPIIVEQFGEHDFVGLTKFFTNYVAKYVNRFENLNFDDPSIILMSEDDAFDLYCDKFQVNAFHMIFTMKTMVTDFRLFNEFKYLAVNGNFVPDNRADKVDGVSAIQVCKWLKNNYLEYQPAEHFAPPFQIYPFMVRAKNNPLLMKRFKELTTKADKIKKIYPNVDDKMKPDPTHPNKYRQIDGYPSWWKIKYQIQTLFTIKDIF